ncbi:MAG: ABC transporter permease, partial [Bdellovibrionales bacterium]|nr:ABC transporter permease [Bdellovibrionales bacterium]
MDRAKRKLLILPFAGWLALLIVGPLVLMIATSFLRRDEFGILHRDWNLQSYRELFDPLYSRVLARTLLMAACNTVATVTLAYPFAFYLSRLPRGKALTMLTFVMIPFWTNFLIRILAFMDVLRTEIFGFSLVYTPWGVLGALVYNYLPFAILPLYASLEKVDNSVLEAAYDLGASRLQILFRILVPLTSTGLVTAAGGAWNASIVAEAVHYRGGAMAVQGIGSLIASSFDKGDDALLAAATVALAA